MFRCLPVVLLLAIPLHAQESSREYRVPFHTVRGLVLLDVTLDGKPGVLILDTGAQASFRVKEDWRIVFRKHDGVLTFHTRHNPFDQLMLNYAQPDVRVDGILGEDLLREFSAVRIDYKAHAVELQN